MEKRKVHVLLIEDDEVDVMMDGLEFFQELGQDEVLKSTPVVVLTTSDADQDCLEAYRLNAAGYSLKPATFATSAQVITALNQSWALCEIP